MRLEDSFDGLLKLAADRVHVLPLTTTLKYSEVEALV